MRCFFLKSVYIHLGTLSVKDEHFHLTQTNNYLGLDVREPVFGVCEQHPRSLISAFDIHLLESISKLATSKGALAIRRIFSLVDMITKPKFSNCPNIFKIGLFW